MACYRQHIRGSGIWLCLACDQTWSEDRQGASWRPSGCPERKREEKQIEEVWRGPPRERLFTAVLDQRDSI